MKIEISQGLEFTFININKLSKTLLNKLRKMPYEEPFICEHGTFIKVSDFKFMPMSTRAGGFAMVHIDDHKKYNKFDGYI